MWNWSIRKQGRGQRGRERERGREELGRLQQFWANDPFSLYKDNLFTLSLLSLPSRPGGSAHFRAAGWLYERLTFPFPSPVPPPFIIIPPSGLPHIKRWNGGVALYDWLPHPYIHPPTPLSPPLALAISGNIMDPLLCVGADTKWKNIQ